MTNFQRTADWLRACGKEQTEQNLSVQIGVHVEEFVEFLECIEISDIELLESLGFKLGFLMELSSFLKSGEVFARIPESDRETVLDALCDSEVTGNGIAYLAGFDKDGADQEVLRSNESKLEDGSPVILPGGKIGKGKNYSPPNLKPFI